MILTYVCFEPKSLSEAAFVDLVSRLPLGFTPTGIRSEQLARSQQVPFGPESLASLAAQANESWIHIEGSDGSLELLEMGRWPLQVMILRTEGAPPIEILDAASRLEGFTSWVIGDAEDMFWQSTEQTNTYDVFDRSWADLPTIDDPIFGKPKIDISGNPGRGTPIPGLWLWAGAQICFGAGSFKIFDRDRVLSVPSRQLVERDDGSVVVTIYQIGDDTSQIRTAQRTLRTWLDFDEIELRADSLAPLFRSPGASESDSTAVTDANDDGQSSPGETMLAEEIESWSRLYAVTDHLEQAIARYNAAPAVRSLAAVLLPIISDIKSGKITAPIGRERYPSLYVLENETNFYDYVDVVNAHGVFREEVTVGSVLTPTQKSIIEKMEARRAAKESGSGN